MHEQVSDRYKFFSWSLSLYSGKARAYLIKQHIDFDDLSPASQYYDNTIRPAIGRWIIPVMQTPDGEIVQDGTDIIDWFEARGLARLPTYPETPRQLITSLIMEFFGGEGMLRPAMHYRWNFDEINQPFIMQQFGLFAMPHVPPAERHDMALHAMSRMRKAALMFGVNEATAPHIEAAYMDMLAEFEAHFAAHPYLLGGAPSIGDYGLFASLFAHLGRDPHPVRLMQNHAPALYRWTERMRNPSADMVEFIDMPQNWLTDDDVPETAQTLLRRVASDFLPEIKAMVAYTNQWLDENQPSVGSIVGDDGGGGAHNRNIGFCAFQWRGLNISAAVFPYRIFMLQRIQDAYDKLADSDRAAVDALLAATGLADILTSRSVRRVERHDNREIWGA